MFEIFVGFVGAAIAAAQLITENDEKRKRQAFIATVILSAIVGTAGVCFSFDAISKYLTLTSNAEIILKGLDGPKTYDEVLDIGNFLFLDADEALAYLYNHNKIRVKTPTQGGHTVRTFERK